MMMLVRAARYDESLFVKDVAIRDNSDVLISNVRHDVVAVT